jgi:hypothetical protein
MNILVACLNMNSVGGSELYHYELVKALSSYKELIITLATYTTPSLDFHIHKDLLQRRVEIVELSKVERKYDLIVVSQPLPTSILCEKYPFTPKISIIHSALRSEEAVQHPSIKHYIAVQPDIYKHLKTYYNISPLNISLIYNPVDENRYTPVQKKSSDTIVGLLVGEVLDPLRNKMVNHVVSECIANNYRLIIVSKSKYDFNSKLIDIVDQTYYTEDLLKEVDFTVGLGGRTTIEGWMMNLPSYIYKVNPFGDILDISLKYPPKIQRFYTKEVAKQHFHLYRRVLTRHIVHNYE